MTRQNEKRDFLHGPVRPDEMIGWLRTMGIGTGPDYTPIHMTTMQKRFTIRLMEWCEVPYGVRIEFGHMACKGPVGVDQGWKDHWDVFVGRDFRMGFEVKPEDDEDEREEDQGQLGR